MTLYFEITRQNRVVVFHFLYQFFLFFFDPSFLHESIFQGILSNSNSYVLNKNLPNYEKMIVKNVLEFFCFELDEAGSDPLIRVKRFLSGGL